MSRTVDLRRALEVLQEWCFGTLPSKAVRAEVGALRGVFEHVRRWSEAHEAIITLFARHPQQAEVDRAEWAAAVATIDALRAYTNLTAAADSLAASFECLRALGFSDEDALERVSAVAYKAFSEPMPSPPPSTATR